MNWADFRRAALRASSFVALGGVSPADAIEAAAQASQRTLIASPAQVAQATDDAGASSDEAPDTSTDRSEPSVPEVPADPAGANLPDVIVTPDVTKPATATPKSRPTPVSTTPRPRTTPSDGGERRRKELLVLGRREHADTRRAEAVLALGHCQVLALAGFSGRAGRRGPVSPGVSPSNSPGVVGTSPYAARDSVAEARRLDPSRGPAANRRDHVVEDSSPKGQHRRRDSVDWAEPPPLPRLRASRR